VSHPFQLVKLDPVAGVAVRVTTVPSSKKPSQMLPQPIWEGLTDGRLETEVTVPLPVPAFIADNLAHTTKLFLLVPMPPGVVTRTSPVVAPGGTVA
jgi:hypothetical protein